MNTRLQSVGWTAYKYSGGMWLAETLANRHGRAHLSILLFHRVTDAIPEDGLTVSTARFEAICRLLRRRFHPVSLAEAFDLARSGVPLPPRTVAITFDDCYRDNLAAGRVLSRHGLPACFFVPAAFVDTDQAFPWDSHLPRLANLTWEHVGEMADMGFEIGSHTLTHPNLATLSTEQVRLEMAESKKVIESRLGRPVRWFAYPFGNPEHFPPRLLPLVQETSYDGCVSAHGGFVSRGMAGVMLPRVPVPPFSSLLHLELYLCGSLGWFYRLKRRSSPQQPALCAAAPNRAPLC